MDAAMHRKEESGRGIGGILQEHQHAQDCQGLFVAVFLCASNDLGPVYKFYTAVRVPSAKAQLHTSSRGATSRAAETPIVGKPKRKASIV